MTRQILPLVLMGVVFAVTVSAGGAEACVFRGLRGYRASWRQPVGQTFHGHRAPAARSTHSEWAWDVPMDVRMWRWPPY